MHYCYRSWFLDFGYCGVTNDLGSKPQPSDFALGLWWASQVVGDTAMTLILTSIPITIVYLETSMFTMGMTEKNSTLLFVMTVAEMHLLICEDYLTPPPHTHTHTHTHTITTTTHTRTTQYGHRTQTQNGAPLWTHAPTRIWGSSQYKCVVLLV